MPKAPHVTLLKQVKVDGKWRHDRALFDTKGRVRRDRVRVGGQEELHPEGSYFVEWWEQGKRRFEPVGADAQDAAEKARIKQAELAAVRNGIIPAAPVVEVAQDRTTLKHALDAYQGLRPLSPLIANLPDLPSHPRFLQRVLSQNLCR